MLQLLWETGRNVRKGAAGDKKNSFQPSTPGGDAATGMRGKTPFFRCKENRRKDSSGFYNKGRYKNRSWRENFPVLIDTEQVQSEQDQTGTGNTFYHGRAYFLGNLRADIAADDGCREHGQKENQIKIPKLHMAGSSHGGIEEDGQQ